MWYPMVHGIVALPAAGGLYRHLEMEFVNRSRAREWLQAPVDISSKIEDTSFDEQDSLNAKVSLLINRMGPFLCSQRKAPTHCGHSYAPSVRPPPTAAIPTLPA